MFQPRESSIVILCISLSACTSDAGGLQSYVNPTSGYEFLYPNGWVPVKVEEASAGVDVVYRDIIERTENLSVVISSVTEDKSIVDLGTPTDVGYRFFKTINSNTNNDDRQTEFIKAEAHETDNNTYYILEYQVTLPDNEQRHNLASVTISNGKLFTFNLSTRQSRWSKVKDLFEVVVNSFDLY